MKQPRHILSPRELDSKQPRYSMPAGKKEDDLPLRRRNLVLGQLFINLICQLVIFVNGGPEVRILGFRGLPVSTDKAAFFLDITSAWGLFFFRSGPILSARFRTPRRRSRRRLAS